MFRRLIALSLFMTLLASAAKAQDTELTVVATTTILADVAQNVAGDLFTVTPLVPPNADAHAFEPTIDDARRLTNADLLLVVGAGYETFIDGLLENAGADIPVVTANNGVTIRALGGGHDRSHDGGRREILGVLGVDLICEAHDRDHDHDEGAEAEHDHEGGCDPHTWMNPQNVMIWVENIRDAFMQIDPANAGVYAANAAAYLDQLAALDAELQTLVDTLPAANRILVTNHEFLGYFADRYGFELMGTILPGGTTGAEPDPQTVAELIATIHLEGVPAIFAEMSANPELASVIADEAGVRVVTALYSESLSDEAGSAATYLDLMRYNAQAIVDALSG